jgi:hypothetical protein
MLGETRDVASFAEEDRQQIRSDEQFQETLRSAGPRAGKGCVSTSRCRRCCSGLAGSIKTTSIYATRGQSVDQRRYEVRIRSISKETVVRLPRNLEALQGAPEEAREDATPEEKEAAWWTSTSTPS